MEGDAGGKPRNREVELETIIVLSLAGLILFFIFKVSFFLFMSLAFLVTGLLSRKLTSIVAGRWLDFSRLIGAFNSRIILTLVFYFFLTPIAVIFRLFTKNPLSLKKGAAVDSYYKVRNYMPEKKDFEKIW